MAEKTAIDRINQTLGMVAWVIDNPGQPVDEVAARFGYTPTGLRKSLQQVFLCGLPGYGPGDLIETRVDEEDRVYIEMADYFGRAPRLTPMEALLLLASGMAHLESDFAPQALVSAVAKLAQTLSPHHQGLLAVDLSDMPQLVAELGEAAHTGTVVEIEYTDRENRSSRRLLQPWRVIPGSGYWYLSAFCYQAEAERLFRLDRIKQLRLTQDSFDPDNIPPPATAIRYLPREDDIWCEIELDPPARWVLDYYSPEVIAESKDTIRVRFGSPSPQDAARLLLQLGPHARWCNGEEVRAATRELATQILSRYRDVSSDPQR